MVNYVQLGFLSYATNDTSRCTNKELSSDGYILTISTSNLLSSDPPRLKHVAAFIDLSTLVIHLTEINLRRLGSRTSIRIAGTSRAVPIPTRDLRPLRWKLTARLTGGREGDDESALVRLHRLLQAWPPRLQSVRCGRCSRRSRTLLSKA